jgi:hypothetical protein
MSPRLVHDIADCGQRGKPTLRVSAAALKRDIGQYHDVAVTQTADRAAH